MPANQLAELNPAKMLANQLAELNPSNMLGNKLAGMDIPTESPRKS
jgi:hypothetical protein